MKQIDFFHNRFDYAYEGLFKFNGVHLIYSSQAHGLYQVTVAARVIAATSHCVVVQKYTFFWLNLRV